MAEQKPVDVVAKILLIVGGLNWGLVGAFKFDLVQAIFGGIPVLRDIIYIVVGLAAIWAIVGLVRN